MDDAYIGELKAMRERGSISASTYQIELLIYWREKRKKRRRKEKRGERDVFSVEVVVDKRMRKMIAVRGKKWMKAKKLTFYF